MFEKRTVIVIGAGASAEVDMPVGNQLARNISETLDLRSEASHRFSSKVITPAWNEIHQYQSAAQQISKGIGLHGSIDQYIDNHSHNGYIAKCGKAAIAFCILEAEAQSKLYVDPQSGDMFEISSVENTWYEKFAKMLIKKTSYTNRADLFKNITVVSFNYDRCLEYYLAHVIMQAYQIDLQEAVEILASLDIIYPYGCVGRLVGSGHGATFGQSTLYTNIMEISRYIRTFTEQIDDEEMLKGLHSKIEEAQRLVFLGFAFHEQNVKLLTPPNRTLLERIFATTFGCSSSDKEVIMNLLNHAFKNQSGASVHVTLADQKCNEFFVDHARILFH